MALQIRSNKERLNGLRKKDEQMYINVLNKQDMLQFGYWLGVQFANVRIIPIANKN